MMKVLRYAAVLAGMIVVTYLVGVFGVAIMAWGTR